ncbi:MAG: carbon-nitrogen family hydrolase [Phycisphaerales bacterium]|nr:carbon-nitrogen family hydrolase [Phycisphaerales bacterium]
MRFLALQYDIVWEDHAANRRTVESMVTMAKPTGGEFVLLPEMGETGFSMRPEVAASSTSIEWARTLARRHRIWLCAGLAISEADALASCASCCAAAQPGAANASIIFSPAGEVVGAYRKAYPFSPLGEARHYPAGTLLLTAQCDEFLVSPFICYDLRFPELWRMAAFAGAQALLLGANWPTVRQSHWRNLCLARAIENQALVIACNRIGTDPNCQYGGGSIAVGPTGEVLAELGSEAGVLDVTVTVAEVDSWRAKFPALRDAGCAPPEALSPPGNESRYWRLRNRSVS